MASAQPATADSTSPSDPPRIPSATLSTVETLHGAIATFTSTAHPPPDATLHAVETPHGPGTRWTTTTAANSNISDNNSSQPAPPPNAPLPLLLIHSNSLSSLIWSPLFISPDPALSSRPLIAIDLPGHGFSSNATDPQHTYTQPAYAQAALAVLTTLGIRDFVVLGWSLGGHVAIELMRLTSASNGSGPTMRGAMIVGSPPVPRGGVDIGFYGGVSDGFASKEVLDDDDVRAFAIATVGADRVAAKTGRDVDLPAWVADNVRRTHGLARQVMFNNFREGGDGEGAISDQLATLNGEFARDVLVAIVNGAEEPFVNVQWVRENVRAPRMWRGRCVEVPGTGHAPFWEDWDGFERGILAEWLVECDQLVH